MKALVQTLVLAATLIGTGVVNAAPQAYPSRPVRWIVGYAPGGGNDIVARLMGQWFSDRLGQPFVIENRPGAGTNIAAEIGRATRRLTATRCLLVGRPNAINAPSTTSSASISSATSRRSPAS